MYFSDLAQTFKKLEGTPSRNSMTEILAELFKKASKDEIGKICYLLQGRVVPRYEPIEFGVADKFIIRAIALAYGKEGKDVVAAFKKLGDLGMAAEACYHVPLHGSRGKGPSVSDVYGRLYDVTQASGEGSQEKKITLLANLLKDVDAQSARYIVRIPLDKLRLGFSDMTMLDGLSWMLTGDKSLRIKLEGAYNVRPDIGYLAHTLKERGIAGLGRVGAKIGAPILPALCQRLPTADEMIKKMGRVAVEPKYDGVRVQIHVSKSKIKNQKSKINTFSRNLENTTLMFPELQNIGNQLHGREVILDGEAIGVDPATGKLIPFQETMTRKRKHEIEKTRRSVPLKFFIFDVLFRDGKDLLNMPFSERRKLLEQTVKNGPPSGETGKLLTISPQIVTDSPGELRRFHDEQLKVGLEGAVVKKWDSPYEPGRRGYSWVKFKEEEGKTGKLTDTIDAVIMGYYKGQGKRAGFGIGMFLVGVRTGDTFVTVTKIGTGVSDELWKELRQKLEKIKTKEQPKEYIGVNKLFIPDVWVAPKIVVEIAGDDLTKSPTHGAGVAVRFPRLVRIRTDKSPREATTVDEILKMYHNQKTSRS